MFFDQTNEYLNIWTKNIIVVFWWIVSYLCILSIDALINTPDAHMYTVWIKLLMLNIILKAYG